MERAKKELSKKYGQKDLRRLMQELKKNTESTKGATEQISSPIAKYDALGNLSCVICKSNVKANVWKVHINSKQHKENVKTAKILSDKLLGTPNGKKVESAACFHIVQEQNKAGSKIDEKAPHSVPSIAEQLNLCSEEQPQKNDAQTLATDSVLPERFFDDPMADALVRNVDYKDPLDNEWEKFQREIKEESTMSNAIIAGEQDDATVLRQLEEIDDQMARWTRVVNLEMRTEQIIKKRKRELKKKEPLSDDQLSSEDEKDVFNEFCNWRSKNF